MKSTKTAKFIVLEKFPLYSKPDRSKNHTSTFYYLLFVKMEFYFYLEKTGAAGPFLPALILMYLV